jgi:hypothetical protein
MDVFYYWKNHDADIKAGRIGYLKSTSAKVGEFTDGSPDFIWAFKAPRGTRGELQLVARLRWVDKGTVKHKAEANVAYINYDPQDAHSVRFSEDDTHAAIASTSDWAARHFPRMIAANFQGTAGQEALRGMVLGELKGLGTGLRSEPFGRVNA